MKESRQKQLKKGRAIMSKQVARIGAMVFLVALFTNLFGLDRTTGALVFLSFALLLFATLLRSIENNERL